MHVEEWRGRAICGVSSENWRDQRDKTPAPVLVLWQVLGDTLRAVILSRIKMGQPWSW